MDTNDSQRAFREYEYQNLTTQFQEQPQQPQQIGFPVPSTLLIEGGILVTLLGLCGKFLYGYFKGAIEISRAERNQFVDFMQTTINQQRTELKALVDQMKTRDEGYLEALRQVNLTLRELTNDIKNCNINNKGEE